MDGLLRPKSPGWRAAAVRWRFALLAVGGLLFVAATLAGKPSLDRSIEHMFAPDDPILVPYRRLQRTFGKHEIVLAMYADPELKSPAGVARVQELGAKLRSIDGIRAVVTLADPPGAANFKDKRRGALFREMFAGYTHNADFTAAGAICVIASDGKRDGSKRAVLAAMRQVIDDYPEGTLAGEIVLVQQAFDMLEADGVRLNRWALGLMGLTIVVCFRSWRWLLLPLGVVELALALANGSSAAAGLKLSMVGSMLGAIIAVVGVATVVHVIIHYLDLRGAGRTRRRAMMTTLDELAGPVTAAVLTDAAGFAALMSSRVGPVHDFGLMSAIGCLMVLPATLLLTPALAWLADPGESTAASGGASSRLQLLLLKLMAISWRRRGLLLGGLTGLVVAAIVGAQRLEVETDFTNNFHADSPIARSYDFVESRFGGAGVWDLLVPVPATPDGATMDRLLKLEQRLRDACREHGEQQLTKAISLADALAAGLGGQERLARVAPLGMRLAMGVLRGRMFDFVTAIYAADPIDDAQWLRIMLRSPERLPAQDKLELIAKAQAVAREEFPGAEATGYYVLLARLVDSVLTDQWRAFGVAAVAVLGLMAAAMRSMRFALATLLPNLLPSLILFGGMGWLGLKINMGAAMIAAVSVGLSVDGSIHYTMHYQRLRRRGWSLDAALADSQGSVGRAALAATVALVVGFAVLCSSDFVPTVTFGALVSLSMVGGLLGNLIVLPTLIRGVERGPKGEA